MKSALFVLAVAAAQEAKTTEYTGLKILGGNPHHTKIADGIRSPRSVDGRFVGADGHGVRQPQRFGADGHGVLKNTPSYNLTRGLLLAQTSYCMEDAAKAVNPPELEASAVVSACADIKVSAVIEEKGSRAVVGYDNSSSSLFVAFRGTENLENWWENIHFEKESPCGPAYPAPYDSVEVETGFVDWYGGLLDGVKDALAAAKASFLPNVDTAPLVIAGHSAGGACAALMAFDVLRGGVFDGVKLAGAYTYGCPRVGDAAFVKAYVGLAEDAGAELWRVTHRDDIVPHLPPPACFDGHSSTRVGESLLLVQFWAKSVGVIPRDRRPEELMGYQHEPHEAWQKGETDPELTYCADTVDAEDDACSNSCAPFSCTSTADHLSYLGLVQGINGC